MIDQEANASAAAASENLGEEEINEIDDGGFDMCEDTDLNEEELDLNVSRKMSIRALNVATMHRFSPGSITNEGQRLSNVGLRKSNGATQRDSLAVPPRYPQ